MSAEKRLKELGIVLAPVSPPVANYVNAVRTGNLLFLAGKGGPPGPDGKRPQGKLGREYTVEQGYQHARNTGLEILAVLRHELGLTGTHVGCEQGVCGACTVLLDGEPVKSCLMLAPQANGHTITTVEGLAGRGELHPVQQAFRDAHALQCGYCTPGFLLGAVALAERGVVLEGSALREELAGNLCRCTGYDKIVRAVQAAAVAMRHERGETEGRTS